MSVIITKADATFSSLKEAIADYFSSDAPQDNVFDKLETAAVIAASALTLWDQSGANVITKEVVLQSSIGRCGIRPITSPWALEHYPEAEYEVLGTFILPDGIVHTVIAYL